MTLGSLFDGSGGFPLAASLVGITPIWASEVEPYPIAVTRNRFPNMIHLGDVCKVNGRDIPPVDIVSFGSPCQDLSVAGSRSGIKHTGNGDEKTTRSGLFFEAIRIIREMREATNGRYPRYAVWENVTGAFSSNGGGDFRTVLEEFVKISEPSAVMPPVPKAGWAYADCFCGYGWSLAYRVFDAQYWGVPQCRRRILLVADFGGRSAGEILFVGKGLPGNPAAVRSKGEGTAEPAERSTDSAIHTKLMDSVRVVDMTHACDVVRIYEKVVPTLQARMGTGGNQVPLIQCWSVGNGQLNDAQHPMPEKARTLNAMHDQQAIMKDDAIRRLTPTECCRLQGFSDGYGDIPQKTDMSDGEVLFWNDVYRTHHQIVNGKQAKEKTKQQILTWYNKLHTDSAEYKMWGNGIALPPAVYVMSNIASAMSGQEKL